MDGERRTSNVPSIFGYRRSWWSPKQSGLESNEACYANEEETIMTKPRIIVTGATGKTGSAVTTGILKAGYPVRGLVRK